jgi:hypothetical protein
MNERNYIKTAGVSYIDHVKNINYDNHHHSKMPFKEWHLKKPQTNASEELAFDLKSEQT